MIDASASNEAAIRRAFHHHQENLQFVRSNQFKNESFTDTNTNYFFILNLESNSNIQPENFGLMPNSTLLVCDPKQKAEIIRSLGSPFHFLNHQDIAISFLQFWEKQLGATIESELRKAKPSSIFQQIEQTLELPEGNTEARARLAYALATQLTVDLNQIRRVVRLALYYPILAIESWRQLVHTEADLVELIPLLEQKLLMGRISLENICPQDLSLELLIVESAIFAQRHLGESENKFRSELKIFSSRLPFKMRTQIRNSAERCFKYLWRENEAA